MALLKRPVAAAVLALAASAALAADEPAPKGYLDGTTTPKALDFLPPPPSAGSSEDQADHAVFLATRALHGTGRWALAQEDDDIDPRGASRLFDCALGARLEQGQPPAVTRLMTRVLVDVLDAYRPAKSFWRRPRPVVGNEEPICVARDKALTESFSYPSGHAAASWAWGLVLAEIEPDRSDAVLKRAGAIGESRVVCGVHYPSDVVAGRMVGAAVVAAEHRSPEFVADLAAARTEIDARRAKGSANPICAAEADALKVSSY